MENKRSFKLWILAFIGVNNFIMGVEAFFIAPTAWYYIKSLGQTKLFLAFVISSFYLAAVISPPIVGYIADRFGHLKLLIVLCYIVRILGNLLYSVNVNAYVPLLGRMVSGLGESSFGILIAQVAIHTSEKNRAGIFIVLEGAYGVGTTVGPALGSFLTFDANIFGWKIDAGNSPGIVLAVIWLLSFVGVLCLPNDFGENPANESEEILVSSGSNEDRVCTEAKSKIQIDSRVLCVFYVMFWSEFFSSVAIFYTPLIALEVLHLQLIHVKLYFLNSALLSLLLYIAVYIASYYIKDRLIFLLSMLMQINGILLLTLFAFTWDHVSYGHYYILLSYVCLGIPYFAISIGCSLLSKITDPRNASFIQGMSIATTYLAMVLSRIVASFIFTKSTLVCFSLGLAFFWLVGVVWYGVLYKTFVHGYEWNST